MTIGHAIFTNTTYQVLSRIVTSVTTLFGTILITRILGLTTFGEYSIVVSYVMTFFIISDFGVNAVVVKDFAESDDIIKKNFGKVFAFRIALGILLILIALALLPFLPYQNSLKLAIIASLPLVLFNSIYKAQNIIFQSKLEYKHQFVASFLGAIISILLLIAFLFMGGNDIISLMMIIALGGLFAPIVGMYFIKEYINFDSKWFDLDYWWYIFKDAFPIGIAILINVLMIQADRFLLSIMDTVEIVGIYNLAYKIFELFIILPTFLMNAVFPILAKSRGESYKVYRKISNAVIGFLMISGLISTLGIIFFSEYLIVGLWGPDMRDSYIALAILATGFCLFYVSAPLSRVALLEGKQRFLPLIYVFALIFNIIMNIIFIPVYSYVGAAVVTVVSELIALAGLYLIVGRGFVSIRELFDFKVYKSLFDDKV